MRKILFVCHGNICRSPMAAGYMRKLLENRGIDGAEIDSAGIGALSGYPASDSAREVARLHGFSIDDHRARQILSADLEYYDEILVMERSQKMMLQTHSEIPAERIQLLGEFGSAADPEIDDPYGGDIESYHETFALIEDAVEGYVNKRFPKNSNG